MSEDKPLALDAYEALAESYAARVDTKPHNAYYERPATLALLPDVSGRRVLDAGCGPGVYTEWLLDHGAQVVAIDASPKMVELARQRVGSRAELRVADLGKPLGFLADESFDAAVSPLTLDYLEDWGGVMREFSRVLRGGGVLVFSCEHPFERFKRTQTGNYFEIELQHYLWRGFGSVRVNMPSYRRPLGAMIAPLADAGFVVEQIVEPLPTEDFHRSDPNDYAKLMRDPGFICIRARKDV
ncbi:MAG: methyltransferase domain-containing protein [Anaerolineae bacterium]|nr:methyltransferase domain-containing protein [Anaerolineae bacterium]